MRIERFGSGFISPERDGTDGTNAPKVPKQSYVMKTLPDIKPVAITRAVAIGLLGLAYLLLSRRKRRNGTSERGSVMAVSGERRNGTRTATRTEVRSPTSTRTEVRSPTSTSTSTRAHTSGNFTATVTGGAGAGATNVTIRRNHSRKRRGWK